MNRCQQMSDCFFCGSFLSCRHEHDHATAAIRSSVIRVAGEVGVVAGGRFGVVAASSSESSASTGIPSPTTPSVCPSLAGAWECRNTPTP